jgi:flagellar biosynthetic protein FlhB
MAGAVALGATARWFVMAWRTVLERMLAEGAVSFTAVDAVRWCWPVLLPACVVPAAAWCGAALTGMAQGGGLSAHPEMLAMKWERLSVAENLRNHFSVRAAARLGKSLVPASVVAVLGWHAFGAMMMPLPVMSVARLPLMFQASYGLLLKAGAVMLAWAGVDYAVERRAWNQRLKMTKEEMREEVKETMGNPQVRQRIRGLQRALRKRKRRADVSRASVVITNPTHYAVALSFDFETMQAPVVLDKGRNLIAAEIREEARWAGVPIVENPPLARSIYRMVEVGESIPYVLYATVAGILAYLYRRKVEEQILRQRKREQEAKAAGVAAAMGNRRGLRGEFAGF